MKMKKIMNFALMAVLTVGLSFAATSCKDDDNSENNGTELTSPAPKSRLPTMASATPTTRTSISREASSDSSITSLTSITSITSKKKTTIYI